ncbi:FmdB family zinc ribbon protein [Cupriavidus pauculus]|uniref:FmdB family zinc ribbon protein n=1 Tax=Cupriavidus pauculus TaxID=82633 RepID=UPI00203E2102|nr:zinc ribbon domain-containing protein [Cupriavidus pauculus]MCM3606378.1 zinc ribbon domain-containing protein [Cupriavidus pauculus]
MPTYDYRCHDCGTFTVMRAMAQRDDPALCPDCGMAACRALVAAPALGRLSAAAHAAHATNERSAAAPKESRSHGAGCGCCAPVKLANPSQAPKQPGGRPWMISH